MQDLGPRLSIHTTQRLSVSGLSRVALFEWADLNVDVVIALYCGLV
jgi:hypothetical protein